MLVKHLKTWLGVGLVCTTTWLMAPTMEASPLPQFQLGTVPYKLGSWAGSDVESPPSAIQMLKPNVVVSRYYENTETGEAVSLLLTHCKDARNLVGDYPPVCYPSSGYATDFNERVGLTVGDCEISLTEYGFVREDEDELEGMVLPTSWCCPTVRSATASNPCDP